MNIKDEATPRTTATTKEFVKAIEAHKTRMISQMKKDPSSTTEITEPGLYFITTTYKELPKSLSDPSMARSNTRYNHYHPESIIQVTYDRQSKFYKHILNQTVPSHHFPKRRKDYPIFFSFIDLSGSRFKRASFTKMPHTHSLAIIPPKTLPRFKKLIEGDFRRSPDLPKTNQILTCHCKRMNWRQKELNKVVDYSSKFYRSGYAKCFSEEVTSKIFAMYG